MNQRIRPRVFNSSFADELDGIVASGATPGQVADFIVLSRIPKKNRLMEIDGKLDDIVKYLRRTDKALRDEAAAAAMPKPKYELTHLWTEPDQHRDTPVMAHRMALFQAIVDAPPAKPTDLSHGLDAVLAQRPIEITGMYSDRKWTESDLVDAQWGFWNSVPKWTEGEWDENQCVMRMLYNIAMFGRAPPDRRERYLHTFQAQLLDGINTGLFACAYGALCTLPVLNIPNKPDEYDLQPWCYQALHILAVFCGLPYAGSLMTPKEISERLFFGKLKHLPSLGEFAIRSMLFNEEYEFDDLNQMIRKDGKHDIEVSPDTLRTIRMYKTVSIFSGLPEGTSADGFRALAQHYNSLLEESGHAMDIADPHFEASWSHSFREYYEKAKEIWELDSIVALHGEEFPDLSSDLSDDEEVYEGEAAMKSEPDTESVAPKTNWNNRIGHFSTAARYTPDETTNEVFEGVAAARDKVKSETDQDRTKDDEPNNTPIVDKQGETHPSHRRLMTIITTDGPSTSPDSGDAKSDAAASDDDSFPIQSDSDGGSFLGPIKRMVSYVKSGANWTADKINSAFSTAVGYLTDGLKKAITFIGSFMPDFITKNVSSVFDKFTSLFSSVTAYFKGALESLKNNAIVKTVTDFISRWGLLLVLLAGGLFVGLGMISIGSFRNLLSYVPLTFGLVLPSWLSFALPVFDTEYPETVCAARGRLAQCMTTLGRNGGLGEVTDVAETDDLVSFACRTHPDDMEKVIQELHTCAVSAKNAPALGVLIEYLRAASPPEFFDRFRNTLFKDHFDVTGQIIMDHFVQEERSYIEKAKDYLAHPLTSFTALRARHALRTAANSHGMKATPYGPMPENEPAAGMSAVPFIFSVIYWAVSGTDEVIKAGPLVRSIMTTAGFASGLLSVVELFTRVVPLTIVTALTEKINRWSGRPEGSFDLLLDKTARLINLASGNQHIRCAPEYYNGLKEIESQLETYRDSTIEHQRSAAALYHAKVVSELISLDAKNYGPSEKVEPVVIHMFGAPGGGKTLACKFMAASLGFNVTRTRASGDKYWSGFHEDDDCFIFDEWGGVLPSDLAADEESTWLKLVSSLAAPVNQAAVHDKGMVLKPRLIICCGNVPYPTAQSVDQGAFDRRVTFKVRASIHPDYATRDGKLDPSKFVQADLVKPANRAKALSIPWLVFEAIGPNPDLQPNAARRSASAKVTWPTVRAAVAARLKFHEEVHDNLQKMIGAPPTETPAKLIRDVMTDFQGVAHAADEIHPPYVKSLRFSAALPVSSKQKAINQFLLHLDPQCRRTGRVSDKESDWCDEDSCFDCSNLWARLPIERDSHFLDADDTDTITPPTEDELQAIADVATQKVTITNVVPGAFLDAIPLWKHASDYSKPTLRSIAVVLAGITAIATILYKWTTGKKDVPMIDAYQGLAQSESDSDHEERAHSMYYDPRSADRDIARRTRGRDASPFDRSRIRTARHYFGSGQAGDDSVIQRNILRVFGPNGNAYGIRHGDFAIFNHHLIASNDYDGISHDDDNLTIEWTHPAQGNSITETWKLGDLKTYVSPGRDIVAVVIPGEFGKGSKRLKFGDGKYLVASAEYTRLVHPVLPARHSYGHWSDGTLNYGTKNGVEFSMSGFIIHNADCEKGDCGRPLVSSVGPNAGRIIGIHCAESIDGKHRFATPLTASAVKEFESARARDEQEFISNPIHCTAVAAADDIPRVRVNTESKLKKTPFFLGDNAWEGKRYPVCVTPVQFNNVVIESLCLSNSVPCLSDISKEYLARARRDLARRCEVTNVPMRRWTVEEVVMGFPGTVKALDLSTSAGIPYIYSNYTKKDLIDRTETEFLGLRPCLNDLLKINMTKLEKGEKVDWTLMAFMKDETREVAKLQKPRIIYGAPVDMTIICQQLVGWVRHMLCTSWADTPFGIGLNSLVDIPRLKAIGESAIGASGQVWLDFDFKRFDFKIHRDILNEFVNFITTIAAKADEQDESYHRAVSALIRSIIDVGVQHGPSYEGPHTIDHPIHGQRSGQPLTTVMNCFAGRMMVEVLFRHLVPGHLFTRNVWTSHHGDDIIMAVNPRVQELYNAVTIRDKCLEVFGMDVTAGDKGEVSTTFKTFEEITFLGRQTKPCFGLDGRCRGRFAVLNEGSRRRTLDYIRDMRHLPSMCSSYLFETAFVGEKEFEEARELIRTTLRPEQRRSVIGLNDDWEDVIDTMRTKTTYGVAAMNSLNPNARPFLPIAESISNTISGAVGLDISSYLEEPAPAVCPSTESLGAESIPTGDAPETDFTTGGLTALTTDDVAADVPVKRVRTWRVPTDLVNTNVGETTIADRMWLTHQFAVPRSGHICTLMVTGSGNKFTVGRVVVVVSHYGFEDGQINENTIPDFYRSITGLQYVSADVSRPINIQTSIPYVWPRNVLNTEAALRGEGGTLTRVTAYVVGLRSASATCTTPRISLSFSLAWNLDFKILRSVTPSREARNEHPARVFLTRPRDTRRYYAIAQGGTNSKSTTVNYNIIESMVGTAGLEDNSGMTSSGAEVEADIDASIPMDSPFVAGGLISVTEQAPDNVRADAPVMGRMLGFEHPKEISMGAGRRFGLRTNPHNFDWSARLRHYITSGEINVNTATKTALFSTVIAIDGPGATFVVDNPGLVDLSMGPAVWSRHYGWWSCDRFMYEMEVDIPEGFSCGLRSVISYGSRNPPAYSAARTQYSVVHRVASDKKTLRVAVPWAAEVPALKTYRPGTNTLDVARDCALGHFTIFLDSNLVNLLCEQGTPVAWRLFAWVEGLKFYCRTYGQVGQTYYRTRITDITPLERGTRTSEDHTGVAAMDEGGPVPGDAAQDVADTTGDAAKSSLPENVDPVPTISAIRAVPDGPKAGFTTVHPRNNLAFPMVDRTTAVRVFAALRPDTGIRAVLIQASTWQATALRSYTMYHFPVKPSETWGAQSVRGGQLYRIMVRMTPNQLNSLNSEPFVTVLDRTYIQTFYSNSLFEREDVAAFTAVVDTCIFNRLSMTAARPAEQGGDPAVPVKVECTLQNPYKTTPYLQPRPVQFLTPGSWNTFRVLPRTTDDFRPVDNEETGLIIVVPVGAKVQILQAAGDDCRVGNPVGPMTCEYYPASVNDDTLATSSYGFLWSDAGRVEVL